MTRSPRSASAGTCTCSYYVCHCQFIYISTRAPGILDGPEAQLKGDTIHFSQQYGNGKKGLHKSAMMVGLIQRVLLLYCLSPLCPFPPAWYMPFPTHSRGSAVRTRKKWVQAWLVQGEYCFLSCGPECRCVLYCASLAILFSREFVLFLLGFSCTFGPTEFIVLVTWNANGWNNENKNGNTQRNVCGMSVAYRTGMRNWKSETILLVLFILLLISLLFVLNRFFLLLFFAGAVLFSFIRCNGSRQYSAVWGTESKNW